MALKTDVVIVGAGGMGALFGSILQTGGLKVVLYDTNQEHIEAIQKNGLQIKGFGGDRKVELTAISDPSQIQTAELLLFQCKGNSSKEAARSFQICVDKGAVCISFQNGLGNEEVIAKEVGPKNVLGGLTAMAGLMVGPGQIRDFARVPSYIGEMKGGITERSRQISKKLSKAGLETHAVQNIHLEIWKKLLGNISMSALSGLTNLKVASLMQIPELRNVSFQAMEEALAVGLAIGLPLERELVVRGMEMISQPMGTGDNKSSLCMDLLNRRPSEVEFIYGKVIEIGESRGVPIPTLKTLHALVKGAESHFNR
jgi:2-dehydropantoate 2-reductase